jgi:beta-glucanase (GH16 family)
VPVQAGPFGGVAVGPDGTVYVANSQGNTIRAVSMTHVNPPPLTGNPNAGPLVEDFSGPAGSQPDPTVFNRVSGFGAPGTVAINTLDPANGALDGNGNLVITARKETVQDPWGNTWNYTSTGYNTKDKFEFTYGTLSARVKVPAGQGLHTTIALFGSDIDQVGWPNAGELDILELYNTPSTSGSALHGPGGYNVSGAAPVNVADGQFHTVWVRWEPNKITTGIDDQVTRVFTPDDLPPGTPWTFNDRSMFFSIGLEVGGAVQPDATTPFPSSIVVDSLTYEPLSTTTSSTGTTAGTTVV